MIQKILFKYKEQINYLFFGILTTLVNWTIYTSTIKLWKIDITIANILAWIIAVMFAYITNKLFVFHTKNLSRIDFFKEFLLFFMSRITSGIVEIFGFPLLYYLGFNQSFLGIDGFVSKVLISIIVIILNYLLSKIIVFKK